MRKCTPLKGNGTNDMFKSDEKHITSLIQTVTRLLIMIIKSSPVALIIQILFSVIGGILPIVVAMQWRNILALITEHIGSINFLKLMTPFIKLAIVGALSASYYFFAEIVDTYFRNKLSLSMQAFIHDKAERIPMPVYETPQHKDLLTRAQQAFSYGPAIGIAITLAGMFSSVMSVVSTGILLFNYNSLLAIIIIFVAIPQMLKSNVSNKRVGLAVKLSPKRREATEYSKYFFKYEFVKETKLWNISSFFMIKWKALMDYIIKEEVSTNKKILLLDFVIESLNRIGYVSAILLSAMLLAQGRIGAGEFGATIYLLGNLQDRIEHFFGVMQITLEAILNVEKGFEYLDLKEDKRNSSNTPLFCDRIKCEGVSFTYPLTEKPAIEHFNLEIKQGEIVALVGTNGAGKTTMTKILMGLLSPSSGIVKFDSEEAANIKNDFLFINTSAVFQDFNRLYMSIRENISIGDTDNMGNECLLRLASTHAGCMSWIEELPNKFDTLLGKEYGGIELSGGQWQQLAIARACFKKCKFIVLDEPTSALDPFNEEKLYNSFRTLCNGKIGIIVTHRIGAASFADKILVMENGKVVEEGGHAQLINKKGQYYELFTLQSSMYSDKKNSSILTTVQ